MTHYKNDSGIYEWLDPVPGPFCGNVDGRKPQLALYGPAAAQDRIVTGDIAEDDTNSETTERAEALAPVGDKDAEGSNVPRDMVNIGHEDVMMQQDENDRGHSLEDWEITSSGAQTPHFSLVAEDGSDMNRSLDSSTELVWPPSSKQDLFALSGWLSNDHTHNPRSPFFRPPGPFLRTFSSPAAFCIEGSMYPLEIELDPEPPTQSLPNLRDEDWDMEYQARVFQIYNAA